MAAGTFERLIANISGALLELESRLEPDNIIQYFEQLGTRFPTSLTANGTVVTKVGGAASAAGALRGLLSTFAGADQNNDAVGTISAAGLLSTQVGTVIGALTDVANEIASTPAAFAPLSQTDVLNFTSAFPTLVLHERLVVALEGLRPEFVSAAVLLGLIDRFEKPVVGAEEDSPPAFGHDLRLDRLTDLLKGGSYFQNLLGGWGSGSLDLNVLLPRLEAFLNVFSNNTVIDTTGSSPILYAGGMVVDASTGTSLPGIRFTPAFSLPSGYGITMPVGTGYEVDITTTGSLTPGKLLTVVPPSTITAAQPLDVRFESRLVRTPIAPNTSIVLLGATGATRIEVQSLSLGAGFELRTAGSSATGDFFFEAQAQGGKAVVDLSSGDGFLKSLTSGGRVEADFEVAAKYSVSNGFTFEAGAQLAVRIPLHVSFAGISIDNLLIAAPIGERPGLPFDIATSLKTTFGPFTMIVQDVGLKLDVTDFGSGNLGIANIAPPGFKFPTGIGLSLDGPGGVTGGGFLSLDQALGRYSGAVELQVFGVGVKAFGVLDTKYPDGRDGYSFVVVISAEFTPVQIGFGFTLNGVGGLLALNRSLVAKALGDAVRNGSLDHLLFPADPVRDAPSILNDLETIYPATRDHQIVGPMAKLGWGTPTLITAELGIVIELPGPRIAVLGVAQAVLPTSAFSLVKIHLAVVGVLDFPKKFFEIDASLYDSRVGDFTVSGDAAFRMSFGEQPNFVMSIGGFNPSFKAPPNFPKLRRASVDLGVNGNPSLTLSGYFALTSNTAQIGAAIRLYASGAGLELEGHVSFDALFVFSPFSFEADLDAGMHVGFHGVGIGIHFHGHLSGPSPYHVSGDVCVSILFWDACLSVSATFGKSKRAKLPTIDPWIPVGVDDQLAIIGLKEAVEDARNWSGAPPPSAVSVVSLADSSTDKPPIDPLGSATLRQKVVPLNQKLTRFGAFKPKTNDKFVPGSVVIGNDTQVDDHDIQPVNDRFARDSFKELNATERLSAPPYDDMQAGFTLRPDAIHVGAVQAKDVQFETVLLDGNREEVGSPGPFSLTQRHLRAMLQKSAAGLGGVRRTGLLKYVNPTAGVKVRLPPEEFAVADACTFAPNHDVTAAPTTHVQASLALEEHLVDHPEDTGRFAVVPRYELAI